MDCGVASRSLEDCRCHWHCCIWVVVDPLAEPLMDLRIPARPSSSRKALTEAELEVTELAALGHSNSSIAAQRRCAERTVTNQLTSAYAKLGLSGRRELRSFLAGPSGGRVGPQRSPRGFAAVSRSRTSPRLQDACLLGASAPCLGKMVEALFDGHLTLLENRFRDGEHCFRGKLNAPALAARLSLSEREEQILFLSADGSSNKLTADLLGISTSAVSTYLSRARKKLALDCVEFLIGPLAAAVPVPPATEAS